MKRPRIDTKFRLGEEKQFPHGARGGGVGKHEMSEHIPIGHVPADIKKFEKEQNKK